MAKNHQRLWQEVTSSIEEAAAVRALANILVDREGRAFVLRLDPKDAEYCIDILDRVNHLCLWPVFACSHDLVRALQEEISQRLPRNRLSSSR